MINEKFSKRLNKQLKEQNLLQKDLAKYIGVNENIISYYIIGQRVPKIEQLTKIAKFLNVTTDYLLGLSNNPNPAGNEEKVFISKKAQNNLKDNTPNIEKYKTICDEKTYKKEYNDTLNDILESPAFKELVETIVYLKIFDRKSDELLNTKITKTKKLTKSELSKINDLIYSTSLPKNKHMGLLMDAENNLENLIIYDLLKNGIVEFQNKSRLVEQKSREIESIF